MTQTSDEVFELSLKPLNQGEDIICCPNHFLTAWNCAIVDAKRGLSTWCFTCHSKIIVLLSGSEILLCVKVQIKKPSNFCINHVLQCYHKLTGIRLKSINLSFYWCSMKLIIIWISYTNITSKSWIIEYYYYIPNSWRKMFWEKIPVGKKTCKNYRSYFVMFCFHHSWNIPRKHDYRWDINNT